jgi:Domain of unknown function (DUF2760)
MNIGRLLVLLGAGLAFGAGNYALVLSGEPLTDPPRLALLAGGPLIVGLLGLLFGAPSTPPPPVTTEPLADEPPAPPLPPSDPPETAALRLLATLQEDGRLIDFLNEEVAPYSDEQIGAATRGIHESLAKALRACVALEPVMAGTEGDDVTVAAGFDPAAIRLVGNVSGQPPFRGVLRHAGWRVTTITVPERRGQDDHVLAPAEVEIS